MKLYSNKVTNEISNVWYIKVTSLCELRNSLLDNYCSMFMMLLVLPYTLSLQVMFEIPFNIVM